MINKAVALLQSLIKTPSFSSEEDKTAEILYRFLQSENVEVQQTNNNIWAVNKHFDASKPNILLNSHHDTVKPNQAYTNNPFDAFIENDTLYGLGSNDAGGSVVSLLTAFLHFYEIKNLKYNLIVAITAEEESSGPNGLNSLLKDLPEIDFAIVGEPTQMNLAIAEKGLLVLDAVAQGKPGHAAHGNTINPIYIAMQDVQWIQAHQFDKISDVLGPVKTTVTQINAGTQHNVVPAECRFVIDVRVNEMYTNLQVLDIITENLKSTVTARSTNLNSSAISPNHPIVLAGKKLGRETYGSPTLSDQSVLSCQSLKIGPGCSQRSHTANEFIHISEIKAGIDIYIKMLSEVILEN